MSLVRRYLLLLVAMSFIGAVAAGAYSWSTSSQYRATTSLYFVSSSKSVSDAYQATLAGQQRMLTYKELVSDPKVIQDAIADAELTGVSPSSVEDNLRVEVPPNATLMKISVDNENAQTAADIANALARAVISLIARLESSLREGNAPIGLSVIEPATPPREFQPTVSAPLVAAGVMAGVLLVVLVAIAHWARRRLGRRRPAEVEPEGGEAVVEIPYVWGPVPARRRRMEVVQPAVLTAAGSDAESGAAAGEAPPVVATDEEPIDSKARSTRQRGGARRAGRDGISADPAVETEAREAEPESGDAAEAPVPNRQRRKDVRRARRRQAKSAAAADEVDSGPDTDELPVEESVPARRRQQGRRVRRDQDVDTQGEFDAAIEAAAEAGPGLEPPSRRGTRRPVKKGS